MIVAMYFDAIQDPWNVVCRIDEDGDIESCSELHGVARFGHGDHVDGCIFWCCLCHTVDHDGGQAGKKEKHEKTKKKAEDGYEDHNATGQSGTAATTSAATIVLAVVIMGAMIVKRRRVKRSDRGSLSIRQVMLLFLVSIIFFLLVQSVMCVVL